jgi:hypothetical protein
LDLELAHLTKQEVDRVQTHLDLNPQSKKPIKMLSGWHKASIPVNVVRGFRQGGTYRLGTQRHKHSLARTYTARWEAKSGNAWHRKTVSALLGNDLRTKSAEILHTISLQTFLKIKSQCLGLCF